MAKSQWYTWKTGWVGELYEHAKQGFEDLEVVCDRIFESY